MRYAFGDCILDSDTRQLCRAGRVKHLGPKAYELLQVLMAARPRVLSKIEIFERVWPGDLGLGIQPVDGRRGAARRARRYGARGAIHPNGVRLRVRVCREGDGAGAGRGAAAGARSAAVGCSGASVRSSWSTACTSSAGRRTRWSRSTIPAVSRQHARITVAQGVLTLEDLGSRNGTTRNGQRLTAVALLADGDTIGIGPVRLRVAHRRRPTGRRRSAGSGLDAAAHDPAAVDDNRLSGHVAARR